MPPRTRSQAPHLAQVSLPERSGTPPSRDEDSQEFHTPAAGGVEEERPETPTLDPKGKGRASSSMSISEADVKGKGKASVPARTEFKGPWADRETLNREIYSLNPVMGPYADDFEPDASSTYIECTRRAFHTSQNRSVVFNDDKLFQRYQEAIRLGYTYIRRKWPDDKPDEYLPEIPLKFFRESMILDQIGQGQMIVATDGRTGYRVPDLYKELQETFNHMKTALLNGKIMSRVIIPKWGKNDSDWLEYWRGNDYEILAVCFRKDAEDFIAATSQYFKRDKESGELALRDTASSAKVKFEERTIPPLGHDVVMVNPSFIGSSISQANTFERSRLKSSERFFGMRGAPTTSSAQTRSYLSTPTCYADTSSLNDIFNTPPPRDQQEPRLRERQRRSSGPDPGDEPSDSSDDDLGGRPPPLRRARDIEERRHFRRNEDEGEEGVNHAPRVELPRFDLKLKIDMIPEWDGDPDTLGPWVVKVNALSRRSAQIL